MPEQDIRTLVSLETDEKGVNDARKALKQVVKDQQELIDAFKRGEKDAKQFNKEMAELASKEKSLQKSIDAVTGEFAEQAKQMREAAEAAKKLAREQEELSSAQGRFDVTSRNVALAGDVESNLRTVGGAVGAFGGAGIESAISKGSEIFAVIEALPRLKEAATGLPNVINAAGQALGTSGFGFVGLMAGAAVAIALVSAALQKFNEDAQKQAEQLSSVIDARLNVAKFVSGGGTAEEAQARIDELNASREAELQVLADLKREYDENINSAGALGDVIKVISPQEEELSNRINELEASTQGSKTEIEQLTAVLEDGSLAANDAAEAEAKLAQERINNILNEAQQAGELASLKARVGDLTQEQIDSELKALKLREAGLKAEIAALESSGDTSEQVATKIAQLRDQLGFLGEQSDTLVSARASARSEAAEKAAEQARKEAEKAQKEADAQRAREEAARKQMDTQQKQVQQQKQQGNQLLELQRKLAEDRFNLELDNQRRLQDIAQDFGDQRVDALEEQNFLALKQVNKDEGRARRDQARDARRASDDLQRNARNEQDKLIRMARQGIEDRLNLERTGYQRSLDNFRQFVGGLQQITQKASAGGTNSTPSGGSTRSSISFRQPRGR